MPTLRAATRGSPLALWQTEHVASLLRALDPELDVQAVVVDTQGDRRLDVPIWELGGKGVFAKEVQAAVLDGRADLAVHSAKDLPSLSVPGLVLASVPERGDPRDALVGSSLAALPEGAEVATGSLRRQAELRRHRPDLRFVSLRGNMQTRLAQVGAHDAIVVAATALDRLGLAHHIAERLEVDTMLPQVAQGALAVECREDDAALLSLPHRASSTSLPADASTRSGRSSPRSAATARSPPVRTPCPRDRGCASRPSWPRSTVHRCSGTRRKDPTTRWEPWWRAASSNGAGTACSAADLYARRMVIVTGSVQAHPEHLDQVLALSLAHVHRSRAEPGCLLHSVHQDVEDANRVVFVEHWADLDALRTHFAVPASGGFVEALTPLVDGSPTLEIYEAAPTRI